MSSTAATPPPDRTQPAGGDPAAGDESADVVVVGSGAAGLAAAVAAAEAGAKVIVLEKAPVVGGTTAVSGGVTWIPNNHHMRDLAIEDSREDALAYLRAHSVSARAEDRLLVAFADTGPEAIRFLESATPVRFIAIPYPDYHPEAPGGKMGGRSLEPGLFDLAALGPGAPKIRPRLDLELPALVSETKGRIDFDDDAGHDVARAELEQRRRSSIEARGGALVGGLVAGCLSLGVRFLSSTRAIRLLREHRVTGVVASRGGATAQVAARKGVVLASGGFEWDSELRADFLGGPVEAVGSPPANEGDGLRMAMGAGAGLGAMDGAWWMPLIQIPGESQDGRPRFRLTTSERALPGSIIVNRRGRRFVNEAHNYNDVGRAFHSFDPVAFDYPNLPAWLVFDGRYRRRYGFSRAAASAPDPDWLQAHESLDVLAAALGIDAAGFSEQVAEFNGMAEAGRDAQFGRGASAYDRYLGDSGREGALACLAPLDTPPFYGVRLYAGTLGTHGGPRIDPDARVLDPWGVPIEGLYAAGNVAASPTGALYGGAGGTIGPALTFGYLAGRAAARSTAAPALP